MIVVTGASGFIGSCLIGRLNQDRFNDIVAVDDFKGLSTHPSHERTGVNLRDKQIVARVDRTDFHQWLRENEDQVQFVFHIGARTDTTEFNKDVFDELNLNFSKETWRICAEYAIPLVYASSAAKNSRIVNLHSIRTQPSNLIRKKHISIQFDDLSFIFVAQRDVQGQIDVAHQTHFAHGFLGGRQGFGSWRRRGGDHLAIVPCLAWADQFIGASSPPLWLEQMPKPRPSRFYAPLGTGTSNGRPFLGLAGPFRPGLRSFQTHRFCRGHGQSAAHLG
jgi:hypothetical protein